MKPERKREHLESTGLARARMYLKAHLSWLDGWPVSQSHEQVVWQTRPATGRGLGQRIVVDRERLRQSQAIFLKLLNHFPKALPKIVGDVTAWSERVSAVLERLKQAVHHGENVLATEVAPWESLSLELRHQTERLVREYPSLLETVRAIVWSGATVPDQQIGLLEQLFSHAKSFAVLIESNPEDSGQQTALLLCDLGRLDGSEATLFPLSILGCPSRQIAGRSKYEEAVTTFVGDLKKWRDHFAAPSRPQRAANTVARETIQFVKWMCDQPRSVRQREARLINLQPVCPILDEWSAAWDAFLLKSHQTLRTLNDFIKHFGWHDFHSEANRVAYELDPEMKVSISTVNLHVVLFDVRRISEAASSPLFDALCRFLEAIPVDDRPGLTAAQGRHLRLVTRREIAVQVDEKLYEQPHRQYLILAEQFFRQHRHQPWMPLPWLGLMEAGTDAASCWQSPREILQGELDDPRRWPVLFEALARLAAEPQYLYLQNRDIARLTDLAPNADLVCNRFRALVAAELLDEVGQRQLSAAHALETEGFPFVELCRLVEPIFTEAREISGDFELLARSFQDAGWPRLFPSLLKQKRAADIARVASQASALGSFNNWPRPLRRPVANGVAGVGAALGETPGLREDAPAPATQTTAGVSVSGKALAAGGSPPEEPTASALSLSQSECHYVIPPAWAESFPCEWHQVVAEFNALSPNARRSVERLLADVWPNRDRLDSEIATLEPRVALPSSPPHLAERLANLRERRDNPQPLTPKTIAKFRAKLEEAVERFVFDDFAKRLEAAIVALFSAQTGRRLLIKQIGAPRHLELLRAILRLREPYRSLGLRLLKRKWCGIDWRLEDEPANRRFVEDMTARGIRLEPWLSTDVLRVVTDANGKTITLRFEHDDIEKLLMGHHFDTCLAPDGVNFFSAVVNSVDVNKRVLYARDEQHRVVGRCLFALGDAGSVLTYYPYCHDDGFPFEKHVAVVAADLAARMNTLMSSSDYVTPLIAPSWYNDGAFNVGCSIDRDDSAVRQALATATEATVVESLERTLAPIGLTDTALALIVELPEFEEHPELIGPLLPRLLHYEPKFHPTALITAAHLANRANHRDVVPRLMGPRVINWLLREVRRNGTDSTMADLGLNLLVDFQPSAVLNILRQTRPRSVHDDLDEWNTSRLTLLQRSHQRLGRSNLAATLQRRLDV